MTFKFSYPTVNKEKYLPNVDKPESWYGLSDEVKFCKKCLMSNQRPNMTAEHQHTIDTKKDTIKFHSEVCDACKLFEKKESIDYEKRQFELKKLLDKYRSRNGSYDVVIPGSGGKDSFYVAHRLKYEYGMHPITCTFSPNMYTDWGWKNLNNWTNAGFANYLYQCDNKIHRFITRLAMEKLLHPFQPWILGQKNFPIKFAAMMKIPLIFYGENPAEYGNPNENYIADMDLDWCACDNQKEINISGFEIDFLKDTFKLKQNELEPYIPITKNDFRKNDLKWVAFSYFEKWHPQKNYYYTVENSDFTISPERTSGTYSKSNSIDDKIDDLHYYTARSKFGIGRTHYDVAQEVRSKDITTDEGRSLIKKFDAEYPSRFLKDSLPYLSIDKKHFGDLSNFFEKPVMDKEHFDNLCDSFKSPHLWKFTNKGWELRHLPYKNDK